MIIMINTNKIVREGKKRVKSRKSMKIIYDYEWNIVYKIGVKMKFRK